MNQKRLEWRVGLFVFIGLAVLGVLLMQFSKGTSLFRPTYNLYLVAKNVGGLKVRAGVLMAGVQIGSVSDIRLNPDGKTVTITLKVYKQFVIHKDARIVIEQSGFLGDQYVAIVPTKNEGDEWKDGDHPTAEDPFNLQEVARSAAGFLQRIDDTAKKLNDAVMDVRRLVLNEETLTNLSTTIGNMRTASERAIIAVNNVNSLVETNSPHVAEAVSNVVFFSEQIDTFADAFGTVLATNSTQLTASMKNIEASTVVIKDVLTDVQAGKGLAGTILRNDQMATNVQMIANNLAVTTSNLNRLGLWRFMWHREVPQTNAPPKSLSPKSAK
jgi:phospholipid/cholesterol/gamma-HCH transport system substrate-binding protein